MSDAWSDASDGGAAARRAAFRALHAEGCFVMPNPWDVGSARWLRGQGFRALATTSAGFAFTRGLDDQDVGLETMLAHVAEIVAAVPDLPVNADFENAYADEPDDVAANVELCVATGVAGLSIEDATGRREAPIYPFELAVERVRAARAAVDAAGRDVLLTARAEGVLVKGRDALPDALRRVEAFAEAGADVLYAPLVTAREDIAAVVSAAGGKPVNALAHADFGLGVADFAALGVRRVSTGSALARAAWAAVLRAAEAIRADGSFRGFRENGDSAPLGPFFRQDARGRDVGQGSA